MSNPEITLQKVQPDEWKEIARLEVHAFGEDEFSVVAFGSRRFDDDVIEERAREMGVINTMPGETTR